jgi:hypothetical protein
MQVAVEAVRVEQVMVSRRSRRSIQEVVAAGVGASNDAGNKLLAQLILAVAVVELVQLELKQAVQGVQA